MNEAAIRILREQLGSRGVESGEMDAAEVISAGLDKGLITEAVADVIRGAPAESEADDA